MQWWGRCQASENVPKEGPGLLPPRDTPSMVSTLASRPSLPAGGPGDSPTKAPGARPARPQARTALTLESVPVGAGAGGRRRGLGPDHGRKGALLFHCRDDIGR